jgi:hypothetical protein
MNCDWQKELQTYRPSPAACLPPALIQETGWDVLLALHSDPDCRLTLEKLSSLVSTPEIVLGQWLAALEERRLVTGAKDSATGELRALLTATGRELLDRFLSATSGLQVAAHH